MVVEFGNCFSTNCVLKLISASGELGALSCSYCVGVLTFVLASVELFSPVMIDVKALIDELCSSASLSTCMDMPSFHIAEQNLCS